MNKPIQLLLIAFLFLGQFVNAQCDIYEDFDTTDIGTYPSGWTMINTTEVPQSYGQVTGNPAAPTPPRYFRMYNAGATTGELIFVSPLNATTSDGNHRLRFYAQGNPTSDLIVGTMDTNDETGTFTPIATITLIGVTNDHWEFHNLVIPAGTDQYIAFKHSMGATFNQVNLDSICLETIPSCLEVEDVELSNPSQTSIDLSWTRSGSEETNWEYVVQEAGGDVPTGNGIAFSSTDSNLTVTINNLSLDTDYEAYVRASCGNDDFGAWIKSSNTIRTLCGPQTDDYCDDFAGIPNNTVPYCWDTVDGPTAGHALVKYFAAYGKNMFELYVVSTTVGDIIAISPESTFAMDGNHRLRIQAGASAGSPEDILQVGTIDDDGEFVQFTTLGLTTDRNAEYLITLPNNGHSKYAFRHSGSVNKNIWINTVCVETLPSCLEVTDIIATDVQYNLANISWTASDSAETTWEYIVQEASLPAPDATTSGTEITTTSVVVPLDENTAYKAYVRSKCDEDDFGAWMASEEFTSACSSYVAEYHDSFEGINVSGEEVKPCWSVYSTTNGDIKTFGTSYNIEPYDGNLMLRFFFSLSSDPEGLALISPEFTDLAHDKQIRFRMNKRANNEADFNIVIGTVADPSDLSTFEVLDDSSLNQTSIVAGEWTEFTIDLAAYDTSLNHRYIVFKPQHSGVGVIQYVFMDDFHYEYKEPAGLNDEAITAAILTASEDYQCGNAIVGSFEGATRSAEFPCTNPDYNEYVDLWYRFTPEESGLYAFALESLSGESLNMFFFTGSSVDLNPRSTGCVTRYTSEMLNAGETYFISIGSPVETAEFSLCVYKFPEVPANDEPSGAISFVESTDDNCNNGIEGYTASATHSADSQCGYDSADVWYTFVPEQTANYTFRRTLINGTAPTSIAVYSGTPGNLVQLTEECTSYLQRVDLVAGETYYVSVSSSASSRAIYFILCAYPSPPAPENDECSGAIELTVGDDFESSYIIGNSTSSTLNPNDPLVTCERLEFAEKGKDIWFKVIVPESGSLKLETRSNNDPYMDDMGLQAYKGNCGALESLYCDADGGQGFFNYISLYNLEPGTEVLVRAWGFAGRYGYFKIAAYDDSPTCNAPSDITINDVTETSAMISWTGAEPFPVGGYHYVVQDEGTGYPGATTGNATMETEAFVENLTPNTTYEVYVRSVCHLNDSAWEGPIVFTTEEETIGIADYGIDSFKFYPNPTKGELNISSKEVIENLIVYNLTGQVVFSQKLNATKGRVNLESLPSGVYLVQAVVGSKTKHFKIVIE